ncbi:MFS transporter [Candidatus Dojkabacteria bacterium]|nr:MFS transporter [Candidatus Dojkabacteria bacterium]
MQTKQAIKKNIRIFYLYEFLSSAMLFAAITIPFFREWGGISQTQIQILQSFFYIFVLTFELPTGIIADRFGRKTSLVIGSTSWVIGAIVYASTPSFYIFIAGEFLFAIGKTLVSGAKEALIYDNLAHFKQEERAKSVISRGGTFEFLGMAAGSLVGAALTEFVAVNHVFMLTAIVQILAITSLLGLREYKADKAKSETEKWTKIFSSGLGNVFRSKDLLPLGIDFMFSSMVMYFVIWFYPVEIYNLGMSAIFFGIFNITLVLSEAFVLNFQSRFEKLFGGERGFLLWTSAIGAAGFFIVAIFDHWLAILLFILTSGAFGLSRYKTYPAILNRFVDSGNRATSISTLNLLRGAAVAIANPIMGYLADWNFENALFILGFLGLFSIIISYLNTRPLEQEK